jgi:hypothetical protein
VWFGDRKENRFKVRVVLFYRSLKDAARRIELAVEDDMFDATHAPTIHTPLSALLKEVIITCPDIIYEVTVQIAMYQGILFSLSTSEPRRTEGCTMICV